MAKLSRNDGRSLVLHRHCGASRFWPAFSDAAFYQKLLDTMHCGVSRHHSGIDASILDEKRIRKKLDWIKKGSERLGELMTLEVSEIAPEEVEVKRKTQLLDELQSIVKRLQSGEQRKVLQRQAAILFQFFIFLFFFSLLMY